MRNRGVCSTRRKEQCVEDRRRERERGEAGRRGGRRGERRRRERGALMPAGRRCESCKWILAEGSTKRSTPHPVDSSTYRNRSRRPRGNAHALSIMVPGNGHSYSQTFTTQISVMLLGPFSLAGVGNSYMLGIFGGRAFNCLYSDFR